MKNKMITWIKQPKNIVLIILLIAVSVYGIIDNNIGSVVQRFTAIAILGLIIGLVIGLIKWLFNKF